MARNKKPRKHPKKEARINALIQQGEEAALKGMWDDYLKVKPKKATTGLTTDTTGLREKV